MLHVTGSMIHFQSLMLPLKERKKKVNIIDKKKGKKIRILKDSDVGTHLIRKSRDVIWILKQ